MSVVPAKLFKFFGQLLANQLIIITIQGFHDSRQTLLFTWSKVNSATSIFNQVQAECVHVQQIKVTQHWYVRQNLLHGFIQLKDCIYVARHDDPCFIEQSNKSRGINFVPQLHITNTVIAGRTVQREITRFQVRYNKHI